MKEISHTTHDVLFVVWDDKYLWMDLEQINSK